MQIHKLSLTGPGTCRPSTTPPVAASVLTILADLGNKCYTCKSTTVYLHHLAHPTSPLRTRQGCIMPELP